MYCVVGCQLVVVVTVAPSYGTIPTNGDMNGDDEVMLLLLLLLEDC